MNKLQQGFTLIELLIVIAIIGILAAVLIPNLLSARSAAVNGAATTYLRNCVTSVESVKDQMSGVIPAGITKCNDIALGGSTNYPSSVKSSAINIIAGGYTIDVTSSVGRDMTYDGQRIIFK